MNTSEGKQHAHIEICIAIAIAYLSPSELSLSSRSRSTVNHNLLACSSISGLTKEVKHATEHNF